MIKLRLGVTPSTIEKVVSLAGNIINAGLEVNALYNAKKVAQAMNRQVRIVDKLGKGKALTEILSATIVVGRAAFPVVFKR